MKGVNVFILGDNVDTDQILPGYAMSYPVSRFKEVAMTGSKIKNFPDIVKAGDIIIGGENFGCGSSREQAPLALKTSNIDAIIAKSYARIFRKNSINIGLPVYISNSIEELKSDYQEKDKFLLDHNNSKIINIRLNKSYKLEPLTESTKEILAAGGLINRVKIVLKERGLSNE